MNHLKANLKSAAELVSLPTTVEELQKVKANCDCRFYSGIYYLFFGPETDCVESSPPFFKSVATIGSSLTSVQHDVRTMQAALESRKKDEDSKKITVNSRQ